MAVLNQQQRCMFLSMRGKVGLPGGFGEIVFGLSQFGLNNPIAGVYQRRYRLKKDPPFTLDKNHAKICIRAKYYWPSNMFSRPQHSYCTKFKSAMTAWGALTKEEKQPWIDKSLKLHTRGNGLFVKAYMLDRELKA